MVKYGKIVSTLVILCLLSLLLIPAPVQALPGSIGISPGSGPVGTTVNVSGSGFPATTAYTVWFETTNVTSGNTDNTGAFSTSFSASQYPRGAHPVKVTTATDNSSPLYFTITPRVISGTSSGYVGDQITVSGTGFNASSNVTIYYGTTSVATTTTIASGTFSTVAFTIPESNRGGHAIKAADDSGESPVFSFLIMPKITLSAISGYVGDQITVSGTGFNASSTVTIYYDATGVTSNYTTSSGSFSSIAFTIPASYRGSHLVKGTDASGDSPAINFFVMPKITLSTTSGYVGEQITVSGTGFNADSTMTIYYADTSVATTNTISSGSFSSITFTIPASNPGSYLVKGMDTSGESAGISFTVSPKITLSATSGYVGDQITVSGTGFSYGSNVTIYFDTASVATTATTASGSFSTVAIAILPSYQGSHMIKAEDSSGYFDTATFDTVQKVTIKPLTGTVATTVAISGAGFQANRSITITFDNARVATTTSDANGSFSTNFDVPAQPAGLHKVRASDGTNMAEADFTILLSASLSQTTSAASPGYVGMEVAISGAGFLPNRTVTVTYATTPVVLATTTTDATGTFSVTVTIPPSRAGDHAISVTDGTNTRQLSFVMESTSPSPPAPLQPEMGVKAEAVAYFDWAEVTDPSEVTYTLQIATSKDFTAGSIVLEKTGLTQSEYTVTKEESLKSVSKKNPYYWHVKAVDGASNESKWSGAGSFYVGFSLSQQALIYIIVGIAVVIVGLLGFWIGRRISYSRV